MHGVGWETARRVFAARASPRRPSSGADSTRPAFPTVAFPNPRSRARWTSLRRRPARRRRARHRERPRRRPLASRSRRLGAGGWRRLSGNEVGLLLGWRAARRAADVSGDSGSDGTLACSIVSSPGLEAVARAYDLDFEATLTGFKWISRATNLVFGFEEALGYLVNPETVRDKDGISAAVAFLSLAAALKAEGRTVADHLDEFVEKFGCFDSSQVSIRVTDLSRIGEIMSRLSRRAPVVGGRHPGGAHRGPRRRIRRAPAVRRAAHHPRRRRARHGAPERHRAQAQGLHRRRGDRGLGRASVEPRHPPPSPRSRRACAELTA
jgi:phosphomannomutase